MANYKLSNDYWEASGIYDITEGKTQRQVNNSKLNKPIVAGTSGQILRSDGQGGSVWDNAATQEEIGEAVTDWLNENIPTGQTVAVDTSLSISGAAADAKVTGDKFTELSTALGQLTNLADGATWTNGSYIKSTDGGTSSSSNQRRSDFINVSGLTTIAYLQMVTTGSSIPTTGIAFYSSTSSSTFISGVPAQYGAVNQGTGRLNIVKVPTGANYARFSWWIESVEAQKFFLYDADKLSNNLRYNTEAVNNIVGFEDLIDVFAENATVELGNIVASGTITISSNRESYEIPNTGYSAITVTANSNNSSVISFLAASIHGLSDGDAVQFASGEIGIHVIASGNTKTFIIPDDCTHIVITKRYATDNRTPKSGYLYKNSAMIESARDLSHQASLPKLSILYVGNSLALDSVSYAPAILSSIGVEAELSIGILYLGGQSLEDHYTNFTTDAAVYQLYVSDNLSKWINKLPDCTGLEAIQYRNWDVISFQQASTKAGNYDTFQPYLTDLIEFICNNVDYKWKMAWNNVHSTSAGCDPDEPNYNADKMPSDATAASHAITELHYGMVIDALKDMLEENPVEIVFPVATATQNARNTSLGSLGNNGELLYDWKHAQEGIACQVEGYTVAIKIMELLGINNKSIINDDTVIDSDFETYWNIPGQHGEPVGSTDDATGVANRRIAQKCAIMACQRPMELSNILVPTTP